jgi:hypothetical protein
MNDVGLRVGFLPALFMPTATTDLVLDRARGGANSQAGREVQNCAA